MKLDGAFQYDHHFNFIKSNNNNPTVRTLSGLHSARAPTENNNLVKKPKKNPSYTLRAFWR